MTALDSRSRSLLGPAIVQVAMPIDRQKKVAEVAEAFNGYMAHLEILRQKLEAGGKDSRSFYPFVERTENQRLTAFRLAVAEVFGEE